MGKFSGGFGLTPMPGEGVRIWGFSWTTEIREAPRAVDFQPVNCKHL